MTARSVAKSVRAEALATAVETLLIAHGCTAGCHPQGISGPAIDHLKDAIRTYRIDGPTVEEYVHDIDCGEILTGITGLTEESLHMPIKSPCGDDCKTAIDAYAQWKALAELNAPYSVAPLCRALVGLINLYVNG